MESNHLEKLGIPFFICEYKDSKIIENSESTFPILKKILSKNQIITELNKEKTIIILTVDEKEFYESKTKSTENIFNAITNVDVMSLDKKTKICDPLRSTSKLQDRKKYFYFPIIIISNCRLYFLDKNKKLYNKIENPAYNTFLRKSIQFDKRLNYWDSSIWNRFVSYYDNSFTEIFIETIKDMSKNYNLDLYNANVCKEFIEFQTRQMLNSYLAKVDPDQKEGHFTDVIPYRFHSETKLKLDGIKNYSSTIDSGITWRLLVVDDFADVCLTGAQNCKENDECKPQNSKTAILEKILNNREVFNIIPIRKCDQEQRNGNICRPSEDIIERFHELYKSNNGNGNNEVYDIILLDYLLGKNTQNKEDIREKGSNLLEEIYEIANPNSNKYNPEYIKNGTLEKFWIFPISAFSYAMFDEIKENGISHHTDIWELASGADPLNTPYLFRSKFLKYLNVQIKETGLYMISAFVENKEFQNNDLVKREIESFKNDTRKAAEHLFVDLNYYYTNYKKLLRFRNKSNKDIVSFSSTIIKRIDQNFPEQLWEHLIHLLYLTAFGSRMHWEEMWEEANYITSILKKDLQETLLHGIIDEIKKHIMKLRDL